MGQITLTNVDRAFGNVKVLHKIDLEIRDGEMMVLVGPSGCGKSTLLRLIAGLDRPTGGTIAIDGKDVTNVSAAERGLAMVFQSYALYPHMTVRQNLAFGLENIRMPKAEIADRIAEAARMLEIAPYLDRRPGQLSGGQKQRVAIGRAVVRNPTAFLLDEPLSNLDAELRVSTRAEISALHERLATTMIYVTHDQVEAMTLADRIVVLNKGRVEQVGAPLDLFNEPASRFVAGFIGSPRMNFLDVEVVASGGGTAELQLADATRFRMSIPARALSPGKQATIGFRPQQATLGDAGAPLTTTQVEQLGTETILHCKTAKDERVLVAQFGQNPIAPGATLHLDLGKTRVLLFDADGNRIGMP
jgi:multiple sugar transport system ATP-binding protein